MLSHPKEGQQVQCWYAEKTRAWRPLHGRIGIVVIVGKPTRGAPRNHGVLIGEQLYVIPAGNLRSAPIAEDSP